MEVEVTVANTYQSDPAHQTRWSQPAAAIVQASQQFQA